MYKGYVTQINICNYTQYSISTAVHTSLKL